jgi:hypothetical protein
VEKLRTPLSLALMALAVGLIAFGLISKSASDPADPNDIGARSELWITDMVAHGGLERTASGQIRKTFEGEKPPEACPT